MTSLPNRRVQLTLEEEAADKVAEIAASYQRLRVSRPDATSNLRMQ